MVSLFITVILLVATGRVICPAFADDTAFRQRASVLGPNWPIRAILAKSA
jgi:hypothetical protein